MFPTPSLIHFTRDDYSRIYEPDADSFLLLDALESKFKKIQERNPFIILEFGSGSGIATTFVAKHFCQSPSLFFAIDMNPYACYSTKRTFQHNHVADKQCLNLVQCNLADPLIDRLSSKVDLLLFNPPYVPTETADVEEMIDRTFAGGEQGVKVIQRSIEQASRLLSPKGLFYMVALEENDFDMLSEFSNQYGLSAEIVLKRRTLIERLLIDIYSTELTMPKCKERPEDSDSEESKSSSNNNNNSTSDEETSKKSKGKNSNGENEPPAKRTKPNDEETTVPSTTGPNGERLYEIGKLRFVSVSQFRGKPYVNIREYYDDNGIRKPGRKGISLAGDQWEKFKELFDQIDKDLKASK